MSMPLLAAQLCGMAPLSKSPTWPLTQPAKIIKAGARKSPNTPINPVELKGLFEHEYTHTNLTLNCYLEYEEGFGGSFDEPPYPERITLSYALANGVDVLCLLDEDTVSDIEDEARAAMTTHAFEDAVDRAQERYEDRLCA